MEKMCQNWRGRILGEKLMKVITVMEANPASCDAQTRQEISELPIEISQESCLSTIESMESAEKLLEDVDNALELINGYNSRLDFEVACRKKVRAVLKDYKSLQKESLTQAKRALKDHRMKLKNMYVIRDKLKTHMKVLPDFNALFGVPEKLPPLPTPKDLFN